MNYLAHLYLSKNNTDLLLGNFLGDFIRGKDYKKQRPDIQKGVILHRHIDTFTDTNEIVRKSKRRLHERYGHYDGIIIDLFFDHFLAKNWHQYSEIPLDIYTKAFYQLLHTNYDILPEKAKNMLPYLEKHDWIYNYQFLEGMQEVLEGMNRRTKLKSKMNLALEDLKLHYDDFENDFTLFFKELIIFTEEKLQSL